MKHSFLNCISLIFAFITSSTLCSACLRKMNPETDPLVLTCRKASDFGFCVITLRSDPRSVGASRDRLASIAIKKLQGHAKNTINDLHELQKSASDSKAKQVVGTCLNLYEHASNKEVPSALKSLDGKAYDDAISAVSVAMKDGKGCQQKIKENPSSRWQMLSYKNVYMHDLSQLAIDLVKLLRK